MFDYKKKLLEYVQNKMDNADCGVLLRILDCIRKEEHDDGIYLVHHFAEVSAQLSQEWELEAQENR